MITSRKNCRKYHCNDIVKSVENFIFDNEIAGGQMLPGTQQLAQQFKVSSRTIHRALDILQERHIVYRKRGQGTFVQHLAAPQVGNRVVFLFFKDIKRHQHPLDYWAYDVGEQEIQRLLTKQEKCLVDRIGIDPEGDINRQLEQLNLKLYDIFVVAAGMVEKTVFFRDYHRKMVLLGDAKFHWGDYNQTIIDYTPAFRELLKRYHQYGIHNLFVIGASKSVSQDRYQALLQAARDNDMFFNFNFWTTDTGYGELVTPKSVRLGVEQFLARRDRSWALISLSDYFTYEMLGVFADLKVLPGRDFVMASYDNLLDNLPEFQGKIDFERIQHPLKSIALATANICHTLLRKENFSFTSTFTVPVEEILWSQRLQYYGALPEADNFRIHK